jgi:CCR4-NOT transcription complex subunit 4
MFILPSFDRDSVHPSGKPPSNVNAAPHELNNHESILSQQKKVSSKSQELPQLGPNSRHDEQLSSSDDKSQSSAHLGNESSDSKQMTSAANGTAETSWRKPHYANIVSQGSSGPSRRFTVLTRELTSTDTKPKATGPEGKWISKKLALLKDVRNDKLTVPRSQNLKVVSQTPEEPIHRLINQLSSAVVKPHARAEEKSACSRIKDTPVQGKDMQLSVNTASSSASALQSICPASSSATALQSISPAVLSDLSISDAVTQTSVGTYKLSNSQRKLASECKPQILYQQKASVSDKDVASVSDCRSILSNQVVCSNCKHQTSAQGRDHSSCTGEMTLSGDQTSSEQAENIRLPRPVSVLSSTDILAMDSKGKNRLVCPPGFKGLHKSSDSGNSISMSSSTCSALCSTSDARIQESCSITDQPDIISWVSECLEDGGDTRQSNSVSIPSTLSSTDTIWRPTQLPGPSFGASNHCLLPPYPGGMVQCMSGDQNPMICCCTFPSVSSIPNQMPEYWNGGASSYMAPGGYNTFYQNTASGMRTGMVGTLLQQPSPPGLYNDWTNGSADSGLNSAQVGRPYSMYSLF